VDPLARQAGEVRFLLFPFPPTLAQQREMFCFRNSHWLARANGYSGIQLAGVLRLTVVVFA